MTSSETWARLAAGVLTVALMGVLLWVGLRRPAPGPGIPSGSGALSAAYGVAEPPDPHAGAEARVRALLDAARAGDVESYLACFTDPLRARLAREADEKGHAVFADALRRAARTRKSHALFAPEADGPDAARIRVEMVYPDRNERQTYRVERLGEGWRVTEVELVRAREPKSRYGEMATFNAPEGVPVEAGGVAPPAADGAPARTSSD